MIECDGLPYNLLRQVTSEVLRCEKCEKYFYGYSSFEDHICHILYKVNPKNEFSWLVPVCGLLHLEMNLGRAFLKLNWEVLFKKVGIELGFRSLKALQYLHKGADHHKLWHMFEIVYSALPLELLVPYVNHCASEKTEPSCDGYWAWSQEVVDPNYVYMQQVFSHLHALMTLRSGYTFFL